MTNKKLLPLFLTLLFFQTIQAQQEFGLYFSKGIWQTNKVNPAFMTEQKMTLSLPGISNYLTFTGPTYDDLTTVSGDTATVIDIDAAILKMDDENAVRDDYQLETFTGIWRINDWQISLGHSVRSSTFINYPKTLPQVVWQGNAQFIGQTIDLSHEIFFQKYHEIAFGLARKFGDKLTLGGKVKYLNGISSAFTDTDRHKMKLTTGGEYYQLTFDNEYQLFSTNSTSFSGLSDFSLKLNLSGYTNRNLLTVQNPGWAFDFGATLNFEKISLSASILDLGSIDWRNNSKVVNTRGTFRYDGIDISGALTGEDVDFDAALDTLENILNIVESYNRYKTPLAPKIYLGVNYQINDNWHFGMAYFNEKFRGEISSSFSAGLNWKVHPNFLVGANYTALIDQKRFDNIGLSGVLRFGWFQVFGVTDNIVTLFQTSKSQYFTGRLGVNLLLNRKKN